MREIVGETPIAQALAEGRGKIGDRYPAPPAIDPRFLWRRDRDHPGAVAKGRSAQPGHRIVPRRGSAPLPTARGCATRPSPTATTSSEAHGAAAQIQQDAEAYRAEIVARSQGDADRFTAVYNAYKVSEDVTTERLYYETMERS